MSLLTERPPCTVEIGGADVPVNVDYRVVLQIDELAESGLPEVERGIKALALFYGTIPADIEAATERMLWFMRCGEKEKKTGGEAKPSRPDFSFSFDAPLIYAAFLDQYGVDLVNIPFLHWWTFRSLLNGLRGDHRFCEVRRCRAIDLSTVKDKAQRKYYREMKKLYALPLPDSEQEQLDAITDALMRGGDVAGLLGVGDK